ETVSVRGTSMQENTLAEMSGILAVKLGLNAPYELDITYVAPP
ncbi:MAG: hypothetical protein ACI92Z_001054, partial [Paracoccaceae bacterium]